MSEELTLKAFDEAALSQEQLIYESMSKPHTSLPRGLRTAHHHGGLLCSLCIECEGKSWSTGLRQLLFSRLFWTSSVCLQSPLEKGQKLSEPHTEKDQEDYDFVIKDHTGEWERQKWEHTASDGAPRLDEALPPAKGRKVGQGRKCFFREIWIWP